MSICEFLHKHSELEFRQLECQVIAALSASKNSVIATGGGTLLNKKNVAVLRSLGKIIYLDVSETEATQRIQYSNTRPLLTNTSFHTRIELYNKVSDIKVNANVSVEKVCNSILACTIFTKKE